MNSEIVNYIGEGIIFLVGVGTVSLVALVYKYFKLATAETNKINNEEDRKEVQNALDRLEGLVLDTVDATNKVVGNEIREAIKDGRADKSELQALFPKVLEQVKDQLSDKYKAVLSDEIGDLEKYIGNKIEIFVDALKVDANK
jgi:hypothetical protein